MKKLVLFFAAIIAVSFASCGPKAAEADAETATVVDSVVVVDVDTTAATVVDSTVVAQ